MNTFNLHPEDLDAFVESNENYISISKEEAQSVSPDLLDKLYKFIEKEKKLKKEIKPYADSLLGFSHNAVDFFSDQLSNLGIEEEKCQKITEIFKTTILGNVDKASEKLLSMDLEKKFLLYSETILEESTKILESILDFKNEIDKAYPGLCDTIISTAIPIIVSLVSICHPPIGLALQTTGVLDKAAEFVKTENLENTVGKMNSALKKMKDTRYIAEAQELGEKLSELSEIVGVSPYSLQKSGINLENFIAVKKEVQDNKEAAEFLNKVSQYAENNIPNHEKDVEKFFDLAKETVIEKLIEQEGSKELINDFKTLYDELMIEAEVEMKNSTKQSLLIFDKIAAVQKGADMTLVAEEKILKNLADKYPEEKKKIDSAHGAISVIVKDYPKKDMNGLQKIADLMTKNTKAKNLAKTHLGSGITNELIIKGALHKEASTSRGL